MKTQFSECWTCLGDVDIARALEWLAAGEKPPTSTAGKPQRIFDLPMGIFGPIICDALLLITLADDDYLIAHAPMLSRIMPGVYHHYQRDGQRADWLTRIHVPLITNPGCWMQFEEDGLKLHFAPGKAYTFNALEPHAFGNDGETQRVHLIFDVLRKDT